MAFNLKKCFVPPAQGSCASAAILTLRLICGLAFMYHGWGKIQNPMTWMGPTAPVPGFLQALAAISEFGGGLAWMIGLLTPLASLGLAITMFVATSMHIFVLKDPFVNMEHGSSYELPLIFLGIAMLFMAIGPGKYSLDAKVFK